MNTQTVSIGQPRNSFPFMLVMSLSAHVIGLLMILVAPYIFPRSSADAVSGPGGSNLNVMTVDFGLGKTGKPSAAKPVIEEEPAPPKLIEKINKEEEVEPPSKLTLPEPEPQKKKEDPQAKATLNQKDRKLEGTFGTGKETKKEAGTSGSSGKGQFGLGTFGSGGTESGFGTGTGTPFPFPWYIENVLTKIELNWVKPYVLDTTPQEHICVVYFVITRGGQTRDVRLERSSGIPALDRSAESAILSSAPFPPLPNQWLEPDLSFRVTFTYTR